MRIKTFMNRDFRQFSVYDNVRSIPSLCDGFKPSQRKCIYAAIKRGENADEIKIAQLGSYTAQITDYHHGESSLWSTLIGLAQNYPGSNNINFFAPNGQFGSRLSPEPAAARYIFTQLTSDFRKIFKKEDDIILKKQFSDGDEIEPENYLPIIPIILVNGAKGMGTGYASTILNYNPEDISNYILARLQKQEVKPLVPWYRGFNGKIYRNITLAANPNQVVFEGKYEIVNSTTIKITELPIGFYRDDYKKVLNKLIESDFVRSFDDLSTEEAFEFIVQVPRTTTVLDHDTLMIKFKLISRESENVTVWDENGHIKEFEKVEDLADHFITWRITKYEERRLKLIENLKEEVRFLNEKLRFILYYLEHTEEFRNKKKAELLKMLQENNFVDTDKFMGLPIWSLTFDRIEELKKEIGSSEVKIKHLEKDTAEGIYIKELQELKF